MTSPQPWIKHLPERLKPNGIALSADESLIPKQPGAYLVGFRLEEAVTTTRPRLTCLDPGTYLYAGSAKGPGGLHARLGRHLRKAKNPRWHIDDLLNHGSNLIGLWYDTLSECELVAHLIKTGDVTIPCPGFGSSDCRTCDSHLLRIIA